MSFPPTRPPGPPVPRYERERGERCGESWGGGAEHSAEEVDATDCEENGGWALATTAVGDKLEK